jgi:hypothetical protein
MSDSADRGASIIARALQLMREGKARGWSHALELARRELTAKP